MCRRVVVCEWLKRVHVTDYNMRTLTVNEPVKHDSVHYNPSESGSTCSVDLATQPNKPRERQPGTVRQHQMHSYQRDTMNKSSLHSVLVTNQPTAKKEQLAVTCLVGRILANV